MNKGDIKLTKPEKKTAAKVMLKAGYSAHQIEKFLDISDNTVLRASKEATPDQMKQFEAEFNQRIQDMKRTGIGLVQKRLLQLIPKERRIDQIVKAGEYLEGKSSNNVAIQVNTEISTPDKMLNAELDSIIS